MRCYTSRTSWDSRSWRNQHEDTTGFSFSIRLSFVGVKWLGGSRILVARTLYFVVNKERVRNRYGSLSRCRPAFIGSTLGTSGSIFQTLGVTVKANTTYTLKVHAGARADYPFTGYNAALLGGNVVLASGNSSTPVGGSFVTDTITYSSGAAPGATRPTLQVYIKSKGFGQVDVDAVTLTAE